VAAPIVFNVALGIVRYYVQQAGVGNAALIAVPLEAAGLVGDATMRDYATLADILAGATNEQTTLGRKTITTPSSTVNNSLDRWEGDFADLVWTTPSGNPVGAIVVCFDPDTTGGTDSSIIPLTKHDWAMTAEGDSLTANVADFARSASAA
jgi:ABC-type transport system substrate-binding protein